MIGWVAGALLGPVFRWFAYRCEVRLWMEGMMETPMEGMMDDLTDDEPIPYLLTHELVS